MNSEPYSDLSKPITFNIEENDYAFNVIFEQDNDNYDWLSEIDEFYSYFFNTLDITQFSATPQTFSFGGPLITEVLNWEDK